MIRRLRFLAFVILCATFATPNLATSTIAIASREPTYHSLAKVSGPILLIKAYQALLDKNIATLLSVLGRDDSPINQSLTISVNNKEIKLRLIHVAVMTKEPSMVGLLKNLGARLEARDSEGRNAAHYAAFGALELSSIFAYDSGHDSQAAMAMLDFLNSQKVDLNRRDSLLRTPLHYAVLSGSATLVSHLISMNTYLDAEDIYSLTPRQLAIRSNLQIRMAKLIENAGSASQIGWTDIAIGLKNTATSFVYTYPFLVATGAISTLAGLTAASFATLTNHAPETKTNSQSKPENSDNSKQSNKLLPRPRIRIPKAPIVMGGGSLGATFVAIDPLNRGTLPKTKPVIVNSTVKRIKETIDKVNNARRSESANEIKVAITTATDLLLALSSEQLNDESIAARRHLVAAVRSLGKLKNITPALLNQVNSLMEKYGKYRGR